MTESVAAKDLRAVAASLEPARANGPVPAAAATGAAPARFGEELPIFCERCGYALHGLPQKRCDRCEILHFSCPECGHHQPINTLRPAAQRILGRIRGFTLGIWVLFKIVFFGLLLLAWFGMGGEWSYTHRATRSAANPNNWAYTVIPREVDLEASVAFGLLALACGMFGRMFLLRWRLGWAVGGVLGALVLLASLLGTWARAADFGAARAPIPPIGFDFQVLLFGTALTVVFGATVIWPIWMALVHLFLPSRTAAALLEWQRGLSRAAPTLARQE